MEAGEEVASGDEALFDVVGAASGGVVTAGTEDQQAGEQNPSNASHPGRQWGALRGTDERIMPSVEWAEVARLHNGAELTAIPAGLRLGVLLASAALAVECSNARGKGFSFLNIGLDVTDPLAVATKGMFARPVDVWICTASPAGAAEDRVFEPGPFHHEIALV